VSTSGGYRIANLQQPIGAIALSEPQGWGMAFYQRNNSPANQFYLQNAYELLDSPGEFYFNKATGTLYYDKRSTDNMSTAVVDAPTAEGLIDISGGSTTNRANHIAFTGITFGYTHWSLLAVAGSVGATMVQGNDLYDKYVAGGDMHQVTYGNTDVMPSAVHVTNASTITFSGDTFTHLGSGGITYGNDTVQSTIVGNVFTDISGSAVTIGDPRNTYIGDGDIPVGQEGAPPTTPYRTTSSTTPVRSSCSARPSWPTTRCGWTSATTSSPTPRTPQSASAGAGRSMPDTTPPTGTRRAM